jgi:AcrR family transcriptional regulator
VKKVTKRKEKPPSPSRTEGGPVRQNIINAARILFADKGYSGAKVDEIVVRARTTKPMVYYYFGSKERLFAAVLEDVYAGMREIEQSLKLTRLPAWEAMIKVVRVTFDYHAANSEWVRLVSIANIHYAKHILASETIASKNSAIIALMRGCCSGASRKGFFAAMRILSTSTC